MSITSDLIRGNTDTIILASLMDGDSYGYDINKNISLKTNGQFEMKEATLYTAFRRMEQSGYIFSYWGDEATGARRRYYSITDYGRVAYAKFLGEWQNAKSLIDKLIYGDGPDMEEDTNSNSPNETKGLDIE